MKLNDAIFGVFFMLFGIAVIAYSQLTFPTLHGQRFDAADFPSLLGCGMIFFGILLTLQGIGHRMRQRIVGSAMISAGDWLRDHKMIVNFFCVMFGIIAFIPLNEVLGFNLTVFAFVSILLARFGNSIPLSIGIALGVTVAIKLLFGVFLRVPLPAGPFGI